LVRMVRPSGAPKAENVYWTEPPVAIKDAE